MTIDRYAVNDALSTLAEQLNSKLDDATLDDLTHRVADALDAGRDRGNEFERYEVSSIYVHNDERFVVSLIVGYSPDRDGVRTPEEAALATLDLTRDDGAGGTHWRVYDRATGQTHTFEQRIFDTGDDDTP